MPPLIDNFKKIYYNNYVIEIKEKKNYAVNERHCGLFK